MSHLITKADSGYRLYVTGAGDDYIAHAERAVDDDAAAEEWRIWPQGVAEHLDKFAVKNEVEALTALRTIGYAYEAGGGGGA